MKTTKVQKLLVQCLKNFTSLGKGKSAVVYLLMDTEEKRLDMMRFIMDNQQATSEQIMTEAYRIASTYPSPEEDETEAE